MESLKIPAVANMNMEGIWRKGITSWREGITGKPLKKDARVELAEGTHSSGIGITTLMMQGANDNSLVPVHVLFDKTRNKGLIVTDEVDAATRVALGNDFTVVTYGEADAARKVAAFKQEMLEQPSRKGDITKLEPLLSTAFLLRAGNREQEEPLDKMLTNRDLPVQLPVYMVNKPV